MCRRVYLFLVATLLFMVCGCMVNQGRNLVPDLYEIDSGKLPVADRHLVIEGLGPCIDTPDRTLHLNSKEPVIILVHGCLGSAGNFRALAEVFAFHGQQAIGFSYDSNDSLVKSTQKLKKAIERLIENIDSDNITIIGHSMGGLVSRKALIKKQNTDFADVEIRLVTISTPFTGINAARHCASTIKTILTMGLSIPICKYISGEKWHEITYASGFIQQPGELSRNVSSHIKIVTDERGSCRYAGAEGECVQDDYVFSLEEQDFEPVDIDEKVKRIEIKAGHVEIVGDNRVVPEKLISVLQQNKVLNQTGASEQSVFNRFLKRLYVCQQEKL